MTLSTTCADQQPSRPPRCTGKERDAESGNDYFGARYYGSVTGRFLTPDWAAKAEPVPYAKLDNPQSLNLYSYVLNNPLSGVDGDGHQQCIGNNTAGVGCQKKIHQKPINKKVVAKGSVEVLVGIGITAAAIVGAPESAGTSLAAIPVLTTVLGGEGVAAKGTVDIVHGLKLTDAKTAADTKEGVDIATSPAASLALPVTGPKTALKIGGLVDGAMSAKDLTSPPTNMPETINKGASAWSLWNQVVTYAKNWISPPPVY